MYSMVLMAALTTAVDMPDRGRRGGGCCGCYGGMSWGGGWGGGWGGCYGMGWGGGWGGCYGMGWGGRGYGYGGYTWGGGMPLMSGYAYSPIFSGYGTSFAGIGSGLTRSLYYNPALSNQANEATIVVHLPEDANLTIDGQATQSRSGTRIFRSPALERGKTFTYTLRAEANRDGHFVSTKKTVDVRAGERSEVTLHFDKGNRDEDRSSATAPEEGVAPRVPARNTRRTQEPARRSFPTPPPER